jgi:hypothetical protein
MTNRPPYAAMSLAQLAGFLGADARSGEGSAFRWRMIAEFLQEYRCEPAQSRAALLAEEPPATGDERWDVFLAALAEHLAAGDDRAGPRWCEHRELGRSWFPFDTAAARVDALVHAPAAFRRRGIFIAPQELQVA